MTHRTKYMKEKRTGRPIISGNGWNRHVDKDGEVYYTRPRYPNAPRADGAQVTTPHPDKNLRAKGFRMDWKFSLLLMIPVAATIAGIVYAIA